LNGSDTDPKRLVAAVLHGRRDDGNAAGWSWSTRSPMIIPASRSAGRAIASAARWSA